MKIKMVTLSLLLLIMSGCNTKNSVSHGSIPKNPLYRSAESEITARVEDLLQYMTLEEKIGQMTQVDRQFLQSQQDISYYGLGSLLSGGGSTPRVNAAEAWADMYDQYQEEALSSRLGIPLIYGIDAVHGHNNVVGATIFPHNIGLGAANDTDLVYRIGRATAIETAATGIDWTFAPCIAVPRDERWGRTYEGYSEDPSIVSRLGAAAIEGLQKDDLSETTTILATAKHFVADGGTLGGQDQGNAQISEEELRRIHLPPYQAAIEAGAVSVMASFSSWNGTKMHGNSYLMEEVLQKEMGFQGFIVSDWAALGQLPGSYRDQIAQGINAGIDMVMVPDHYIRFIKTMISLTEEGTIPMERIDQAVSRILKVKFELGLFENPLTDRSLLPQVGSAKHRELARESVAKSQVLLKNDGILPLSKDLKSLVVSGDLSDDLGAQCGGWTISWQGSRGEITQGTTIYEAIKQELGEEVQIYRSLEEAGTNPVDAIILVVGEEPYAEGRGDNQSLEIPSAQQALIRKASEMNAPLITLLISGRPMIVTESIELSDAFIASWLPGTEGSGVSDILWGNSPPTGKLSYSWPRSISQVPVNLGDENYDPLFPLGYGLTY